MIVYTDLHHHQGYIAGYHCAQVGRQDVCPFPVGSILRPDWERGWQEGRAVSPWGKLAARRNGTGGKQGNSAAGASGAPCD